MPRFEVQRVLRTVTSAEIEADSEEQAEQIFNDMDTSDDRLQYDEHEDTFVSEVEEPIIMPDTREHAYDLLMSATLSEADSKKVAKKHGIALCSGCNMRPAGIGNFCSECNSAGLT